MHQGHGLPIKLRWVDINKGDESKPIYRSRVVAKEIKTGRRPDLFAAAPPIEHLKYLILRVASSQRGSRPTRLMVQDVKKAYCFVEATRKIYIELPPEDAVPGKVGLRGKSLFGTCDAALNWTTAYTRVLVDKLGFKQRRSTPCSFFDPELKVRTVVHGDDFASERAQRESQENGQDVEGALRAGDGDSWPRGGVHEAADHLQPRRDLGVVRHHLRAGPATRGTYHRTAGTY